MGDFSHNQFLATHGLAAIGSVTIGTAFAYPFDTTKVIVQVGSIPGKGLPSFQALYRAVSLPGISGLYSGFGWAIPGRILSLGGRFGVFEIVTAFYKDGLDDNYVTTAEAMAAGMVGGVVESIIGSPFELMKLRTQVAAACRKPNSNPTAENSVVYPSINKLLRGYSPDMKTLNYSVGLLSNLPTKSSNLVGALRNYPWMMTGSGSPPSVVHVRMPGDVISLEGWSAMWRGLRSGIVRDTIFGGIFFGCWQFLHQAMLDWKAVGMDPEPRHNKDVEPLSPLSISLAAGFSGSVAAAVSHWADTAKSRAMCAVLPKFMVTERKMMRWKTPGGTFEKLVGIHPQDRKILSCGRWLRVVGCGIASFSIVGSYYLTVRCLPPSS